MGESAPFFIKYLAERLKNRDSKILSALEGLLAINPKTDKEQQEIQSELQIMKDNIEKKHPLPHYLEDHDYSNYNDHSFTLDQKYAGHLLPNMS